MLIYDPFFARSYTSISLDSLLENKKILSQISWTQDSNQGPSEYKLGKLLHI